MPDQQPVVPQAAVPPPVVPADRDWTVDVADRIESTVAAVRDKTTVPITKIARIVVFGVVVGVMAVVALIFLVIGVLRLHAYLPFHPEGRRMWVSYVGLGAIFVGLGGFFWRKRTPSAR